MGTPMPASTNILILEPVPTDAEIIDLQLRKAGFPFSSKRVATKDLFEKAFGEFSPDIVIADQSVTRFDVLERIRKSKRETPGVRWIVISASGTEELAVDCMKAGATEYVPKRNLPHLGALVKAVAEAPPSESSQIEAEPPREQPPDSMPDVFRQAIESAGDLIAILDLDGKRLYNNPSYGELLDEPDTLEGTSSFVDVHPDDREKVKNVFRTTVATGEGQRLEYRLVDRDGNIRYIESQGSVIRGESGEPEKVVIISRDISNRRGTGEIMRLLQEEIARNRGDDFFPGLVRGLAETLNVRYALVSECVDRRRERVRALAYWASGAIAPPFEYDVTDTTCERVIGEGKTTYFAADVQTLFPKEAALASMNAYAYLGTPLIDSTGNVIGHLFVMHDKPLNNPELVRSVVTVAAARAAAELEHRQIVAQLSSGEEHYRVLLEEMTDGLIVTDMEDVITFVNYPMTQLSGYGAQEMIGKLATTLLIPDEDRRTLYERNERRREGLSERYEASLKRKDGTVFEAMISAAPHRLVSGEVVGTLALVTPRGIGSTPVERSDDEAGLLEKAQDAVYVCDPEDHILFWNSAAGRLYGWTADEARGKSSAELLHTEQIHRLGGAAHTTLVEGYWAGELRQQRKDGGTVLVDSRWTLVRDAEGHAKSVLVISTDITGKRELEVYELRARHMEGIARLASAIAADLDSMLTPVMLAVPAIAEKASDDSSRQAVALVATNARRGAEMANQVLALAENAGSGKGLLDPSEILAETVRTVQASMPSSITLETAIPGGLWALAGTGSQIQQILTNICTNAREAMPDGGVLRIAAENLLIEPAAVSSVPHALPGMYVVITISDTGHGIPSDIIGKVFDPFFTTKPPGRTTGLGLSTAAAIARTHRGFINIYSEVGEGTNVKVYLPAGEVKSEGLEADLHLGGGQRVIIAQQQASLRDIIKKILDAHGYEAITVADGAEAVALCRKPNAAVAAIIIDLDMPYMDGSATIRVVQNSNPSVRIVATGGKPGEQIPGIAESLPKPFSTSNLLAALARALSPPA